MSYRPILVIAQATNTEVRAAYLGDDAAIAEQVYSDLSQDPDVESVSIYYYPTPRLTAYPASTVDVLKHSLAAQRNPDRERFLADAKAVALARLTTEKKAELEAQATAEAEAAYKAGVIAKVAVKAVTDAIAKVALGATKTTAEPAPAEPVTTTAEPATATTTLPPSGLPTFPPSNLPSDEENHFGALGRRRK